MRQVRKSCLLSTICTLHLLIGIYLSIYDKIYGCVCMLKYILGVC
jgi:hypothetical protein